MAFTIIAAFSGLAKAENNLPNIMKKGAPGGWPTSSLFAVVMYSPQSQRLVVCSMVDKNTKEAIAHTTQPVILFSF